MNVESGIIYIRIQLLKCEEIGIYACGCSGTEVPELSKVGRLFRKDIVTLQKI